MMIPLENRLFQLTQHQSPFARNAAGQLVDIQHVENGKRCNCTCLACGQPLVAKQGELKAWHFAHAIQNHGDMCAGGLETALHIAAKELLEHERLIATPQTLLHLSATSSRGVPVDVYREISSKQIKLDTVTLEQVVHHVRPDVLATVAGRPLIIEITVSHGLDATKKQKLREMGIAAMEVNLRLYPKASISLDDLRDLLVTSFKYKEWVVNSVIDQAMVELKKELDTKLKEHEEQHYLQREIKRAVEISREPWEPPGALTSTKPAAPQGGLIYTMKDGTEVVLVTRPINGIYKILNLSPDSAIAAGIKERFQTEWLSSGEVIFPKSNLGELMGWLVTRAASIRN